LTRSEYSALYKFLKEEKKRARDNKRKEEKEQ